MENVYVQYVILANMYHFIRQDHIMATQSEKKLIKAAEIVKYVVSELGSISSISCFDKEKCLFFREQIVNIEYKFPGIFHRVYIYLKINCFMNSS